MYDECTVRAVDARRGFGSVPSSADDVSATSVLTQVEIEREIVRLINALQGECLEELRQASIDASTAEVRFKVTNAKAYLSATGPIATRQAMATVATAQELQDRLVQDKMVVLAREKLAAYRASLDSLRTLLVGVREQTR